ncbi:MAG TPA: pseudouridine synthase, partial [Bradyrhizobium sp.]|nr:pseudouridine synthase [Bradyrhizobium sp.]
MPRDNDKNDGASRGRRDRPSGGKGRSGAARGPEKKFAKRGFAGKSDGEKRPTTPRPDGEKRTYAGKPDGAKSYGKKPYSGPGKPYAGKREGPPPRRDGDAPRRSYGDAPQPARFNRDDRPARSDGDRPDRGPRKDFRPRDGGGEKRPYTPRE